jgi:hypothetical protein
VRHALLAPAAKRHSNRPLLTTVFLAVPMPFPADLIDPSGTDLMMNPFGSSATPHASHFAPPALPVLANAALHPMPPGSPSASPTSAEFPPAAQAYHHPLARHHSYQHLPYGADAPYGSLPPSPGPLDPYAAHPYPHNSHSAHSSPGDDGRQSAKRQRTAHPGHAGELERQKTLSRARSDSAPLGYALGASWGPDGRPRSGSGLAPGRAAGAGVPQGRREEMVLPTLAPRGAVMGISAASKGQ